MLCKQSKLSWNIDYICHAIVNNFSFDLSDYDLTLWDEAIIQHLLIYKYGLTLKAWGLEKLPTNTKDIHKLLEKNVYHKVDDIYNCLT
jgi:hypothetical protein